METKRTRPLVSQIVIDEYSKVVDSQDDKGLEKYNRTIDDASDEEYNWELMAIEESVDLNKYLVRRIMQLKKEIMQLKESMKNE
jgi:hypothetical protein